MSNPRRLFSEAEVSAIMERAVKLQEESAEAKAYTPGVSREELDRIASELGVNPAFLDEAIAEHLQPKSPEPERRKFSDERVIEGEIDPAEYDLLLEQIKVVNSRHHPVQQFGRTLRAQTMAGGGLVNLEVTSRNGRTRVKATSFPIAQIMGTFYPAFIATMISTGILGKTGHPIEAAMVGIGLFGAAAIGCRAWMKKTKASIHEMVDSLADWVEKNSQKAEVQTETRNIEAGSAEFEVRLGQDSAGQ
ncbi:MAG: hypothetical protein K1X67_13155 [Fimbriimonadaceae bacterium]|nr:hypothetical protein [Fimbriimonadaceae bacterium]